MFGKVFTQISIYFNGIVLPPQKINFVPFYAAALSTFIMITVHKALRPGH